MASALISPCCRPSHALTNGAPFRRPVCSRRCGVVVRAEQQVSRRAATAGTAALAAALLTSQPASAFLGFGEDKGEIYAKDTAAILASVKDVVSLDREDPSKEQKILDVRTETNNWVARYRRDNSFAGRPSYSNTYSVLNALAGHYNSFGLDAPFPKKRLDRMMKELTDAEKFLSRGR